MLKTVYISRFLAGFMLIIFSLSITPKKYLHTTFAKHVDSRHEKSNNKPYQLSHSGYNCYTDNLVAESSFENRLPVISFPSSTLYSSYIVKDISFASVVVIYSSLRGPPVNS